jgi:hypothetical protein
MKEEGEKCFKEKQRWDYFMTKKKRKKKNAIG